MSIQRCGFLLCALILLAGRRAAAGNLIVAGQFDQAGDIDAWTVISAGGEAEMSFDVWPDESDCAGSGSALLVTSAPEPPTVQYTVCAGDVVGGEEYAVGLEVYFPDGDVEGSLFWGVSWFEQPDCSGTESVTHSLGPVGYAPEWQAVEFRMTTIPEYRSARVELAVTSFATPDPLRLNIDHVFVRPVADIFADGFELGETCRWTTN